MNKILKGVLIGALGACFILWAISHKTSLRIEFQVVPRYFTFSSEFSSLRISWSDWEMPVPVGGKPIPTPLFKFNSCGFISVKESRFPGPFSFHEPSFLGAFSASTQTVSKKVPERVRATFEPLNSGGGRIASPASFYHVFPHICIPMWLALLPLIFLVFYVTRRPRAKTTKTV